MTLILWDLDRTLFNTQWFLEESDRALAKTFNVDPDALGDWVAAAAAPSLFAKATDFDPEVLCALISERWNVLFPDSPTHPTSQALLDVFLSEKRALAAVYPDIQDALEWCRRNPENVQSVFSQGKPSYQNWKLEKSGLTPFFDLSLSRITQHEKIDETFFQHHCHAFKQVVVIDDKPSVVLGLIDLAKKQHLNNLHPVLIKRSDSQHARGIDETSSTFPVISDAGEIESILKELA